MPFTDPRGYIVVVQDGRRVYQHILVKEQELGRRLVAPECVHHIDGVKGNNVPNNLILCTSAKAHKMIHMWQRISEAGGNPYTEMICSHCQQLTKVEDCVASMRYCRRCETARGKRRRLDLGYRTRTNVRQLQRYYERRRESQLLEASV